MVKSYNILQGLFMKVFIILVFGAVLVMSSEYYAKVNPYEVRDISANVSGQVTFIDEGMLGRILSEKAYLKIDSILDHQELHYISDKLEFLRQTVKINQEVLKNLQGSTQRKRDNYKRVASLKIKSQIEKDREYHDMISSENMLLNTEKAIQTLKVQITDLKLRAAQLKRSIFYKNLKAKGFVLYELLVKPGQVVNPSTPLAKIADTSKAKLTIYLNKEDVADAKKKVVYIDGIKTPYKVTRISFIADTKNISKYMAQIIIKAPAIFSKLVKIELKDE